MCTQECLVLGHSDNCWMPPSLRTYPSNSPVSTFANREEWAKDKLLTGSTLTRSWDNDGPPDQFGDRKHFGGAEGHFNNMTDIPMASLKCYKHVSRTDSPKEQQL
ncbi:hypothetical protein AAFF_G00287570 [Aldrovandia affinis]|uniref:Protocadherin-9 n=1 Tax=Aldrovandia affinis TaxID=143900 RepID=A0AAD7WRU0_9TELE|nr:hypothetical protein AAFF_G00287570 [Aldrovandia affinis]